MLGIGFVKNFLILSLTQFGFSLSTEIIVLTTSITKPRNYIFFELVLQLICNSVLQNPI